MTSMNLMNKTWDEVQVALSHDQVLTELWAELTECSIKYCPLSRYSEYFQYIGCGSFKEAYMYTSPVNGSKFIVKICSEENDTFEEAQVLNRALDADVPGFVPTLYLPVSPAMNYLETETEIEDEDSEYGYHLEWITPDSSYVAVQPMVEVLEDMGEINRHCLYGTKLCRRIPALSGNRWFPISNTQWLRDYSTCYGEEMMKNFVKFVFDWGINDLHSGNIGYFEGKPVIFDWLS